jgi:hypothetical protein
MTRLTTKDASVLARVAQYNNLSKDERLRMLDEAGPEGKHIGRVLLKLEEPGSDDVRDIVNAINHWVGGNRQIHRRRQR